MYGPKLNCFTEPDYGVPGNADTIGVITSNNHLLQPRALKKFVPTTQRATNTPTRTLMTPLRFFVKEAPDANCRS